MKLLVPLSTEAVFVGNNFKTLCGLETIFTIVVDAYYKIHNPHKRTVTIFTILHGKRSDIHNPREAHVRHRKLAVAVYYTLCVIILQLSSTLAMQSDQYLNNALLFCDTINKPSPVNICPRA